MLAYTYVERENLNFLTNRFQNFQMQEMRLCVLPCPASAAVIFISSTVLYPGQFRELQWDMRWWESWKKQEKM